MSRGFYARDAMSAEAIQGKLEEAGFHIEAVTQVDLLAEGMSLLPKQAYRVNVAERDYESATEAPRERASELLDWAEDLLHLSPLAPVPGGPMGSEAPATPALTRAEWEHDAAAWMDDLFSDDEELSESVLSWIEASSRPTAPEVGLAIERAVREGREDLVYPLCRTLKPVVPDVYIESRDSGLLGNPIFELMKERSPGTDQAIQALIELSWDDSAVVRRLFCVAAGQLESETFLPALVTLLDDREEEVRYEASGALYGVVHKDFDYDSEAPAEERAIAVARWKEWLARRRGTA